MRMNLCVVGGISAILYAVVSLFLYVFLWTRWNILQSGTADQTLAFVERNSGEWKALWWGITIIPYAMIPVFLAVLKALWRDEPSLASLAFIAGMIALILGVIGPLRSATITGTLAHIHAAGNEMQKTVARVMYAAGESYGKGLFCLFGAT